MKHKSCAVLPHGYRWEVVVDPTGLFLGRIFREIDLETDCPDENGWANGTIFQHIKKPIRKVFRDGQLITVDLATASAAASH